MIAEEGIDNFLGSSSKPPDSAAAEVKLKETLNEEIHQVIFKESLHEAVMELALKGGKDGHDLLNKDSTFLPHVQIHGDNETFSGSINVEEEENDAKIGSGGGENGVHDENIELNGNIENEGSKEQEMYTNQQQGTESVGHHLVNKKDPGNGGGGTNGGRSYVPPMRPNGEDYGGGGGGGGWLNGGRSYMHPIRPDAEDCAFYMKTGSCKFGATCRFNHSTIRKNQGVKDKPKTKAEYFEQPGVTECKYYLTPGGCKYGEACKYSHKRERFTAAPVSELNFLGLPVRLGEKECPYYMRHGSCKYGSTCIFNHPHPASAAATEPTPNYGNGGSVWFQNPAQSTPSSWSALPMTFPANQHIPLSNPVWNGYSQGHVYPSPERSLPTPPAFAVNNPAAEANCFAYQQQQQMPFVEYPERPGQPECSHFIKTGDCKFKSNCRFHHPKTRLSNSMSFALSDKGLPLRPDQSICSYYNRYGICKFGPACRFDHPENRGSSASSVGAVMGRKEMKGNLS